MSDPSARIASPFPLASLSDVLRAVQQAPAVDAQAQAQALAREPQLTKPTGALGRLEGLAAWWAGWRGRHPVTVDQPFCMIFAGNHGVAARGVSAYPPEVTVQMVANYQAGGAAINQLCRCNQMSLQVFPLELDRPTADFSQTAAMSEADLIAAMTCGVAAVMAAADAGMDLLCVGEMGIGNTTSAAAVCLALFGGEAADWTGPGTGVSGTALTAKAQVVAEAVALHGSAVDGTTGLAALELFRRLGGRELAAIAGAVLAARWRRVPVILDGFITTAAAAALEAACAGALDHCIVSHKSCEPGHARLFQRLDKEPLLDLGLRLGEGSGAALAVPLVRAAAACHAGMATFTQAGVSDKAS